jgi:hypothetical protein
MYDMFTMKHETYTVIIEYLCYSSSVFLSMYLQLLIWPVMPGP